MRALQLLLDVYGGRLGWGFLDVRGEGLRRHSLTEGIAVFLGFRLLPGFGG